LRVGRNVVAKCAQDQNHDPSNHRTFLRSTLCVDRPAVPSGYPEDWLPSSTVRLHQLSNAPANPTDRSKIASVIFFPARHSDQASPTKLQNQATLFVQKDRRASVLFGAKRSPNTRNQTVSHSHRSKFTVAHQQDSDSLG
jgi:hypothetical protein